MIFLSQRKKNFSNNPEHTGAMRLYTGKREQRAAS
jgi:hypothetical protein